ncbi:MAG TPA: hypothetical protein VMV40_01655 [Acidiferrobacter sp.]|nr:hypothetical protein [Acidiferrobacter sp.]
MALSISLLTTGASAADTKCYNPALTLWSGFYKIKPGGSRDYFVEPYTVNIVAIYDLSKGTHNKDVGNYILWYYNHLNYDDRFGLSGSMYDYWMSVSGCAEKPTNSYDSADAYAGTFLTLVYRYYRKTGDIGLLKHIFPKLKDVAYIIPYLRNGDTGLVRALPDTDEEYLMDNCEDYGGITAFLRLIRVMGIKKNKALYDYYEKVRKSLKAAIIGNLYDGRRKDFDWAIIDADRKHSSLSVFYPDLYAQLFPILYKTTSESTVSRIYLWKAVNKALNRQKKPMPLDQRAYYELTAESMNVRTHH